ncbi:MAG TPA: hypothetical protein DCS28_01000, partial [Candidatus Moranbacteria bacterium]|nr:hypothetical protein [Candidatus Moranbacteria bacterium]
MALTAEQKYYIKKNIEPLGIKKNSENLSLPEKNILKYLKNHLPEKKYRKITGDFISGKNTASVKNAAFDLKQFLLNNTNYFVLFFLLIFIVYLNSFDNAFVSDDILGTQKNSTFLDWNNLRHLSAWPFLPNFILFKLGLTTPFFFRIIGIFFHLGSVYFIFIILNILAKKNTAIFAALLFAVHPILIESVAWISGRSYSQYGFFFLASLLCYLLFYKSGKNNPKLFWLSVFFFFLAVLSSEKAVALLAIFPLYELAFGNFKKTCKKLWPFLFIAIIFATIYLGQAGQRISDLNTQYYSNASGLYNPLEQIPIAIGSYLGLIFWPDKLTLYHSEMSFSAGIYSICLLVFLIFGGLIFYGWKKNKFIFFWLSFFFISLAPTLTPLKISWIVAERYAYIGTLGILATVAYFFNRLLEKFPAKKIWFYSFFAIIILLLSIRAIARNIDWDSEDNLYLAAAETSPSSPV